MRVPQPKGRRGSLKWIQAAVNEYESVLNRVVRSACGFDVAETICWVSPLCGDEYAEYRDDAFIEKVGVRLQNRPLRDFWPKRGPQWDALGRTRNGTVLLVEAKANIPEIVSTPSQSSEASRVVSHLWGKIEMAYPLGEKKKQLVGSCKTQRRTRHG